MAKPSESVEMTSMSPSNTATAPLGPAIVEPNLPFSAAVLEVENLESFTVFPRLPFEIRLKIWRCAAHFHRNLEIFLAPVAGQGDISHIFKFQTSLPPPAILHISKEARTEGLKHYILAFGSKIEFVDFTISTLPRIYYNRLSDLVCFTGPSNVHCQLAIEDAIAAHKIPRLGINVYLAFKDNEDDSILDLVSTIDNWFHPKLEEIMLYSSPDLVHGHRASKIRVCPLTDGPADMMRSGHVDLKAMETFSGEILKIEDGLAEQGYERTGMRAMVVKAYTKKAAKCHPKSLEVGLGIPEAALMIGAQLMYYESQEDQKRAKMRVDAIKEYEDAGKAIPEKFPFERVDFRRPDIIFRHLMLDLASSSAQAKHGDLTEEAAEEAEEAEQTNEADETKETA